MAKRLEEGADEDVDCQLVSLNNQQLKQESFTDNIDEVFTEVGEFGNYIDLTYKYSLQLNTTPEFATNSIYCMCVQQHRNKPNESFELLIRRVHLINLDTKEFHIS